MPQLIPFYFINQVTAAFAILSLMIYIFSKYSLPLTVRLFLARIFVTINILYLRGGLLGFNYNIYD
jgi:F-type H+-transporting ATPase subunit 8